MERPAIVVPKEKDRAVMVGGSRCEVSEQEWIAAALVAGDRVRITPRASSRWSAPGEAFEGVVVGSGFYDGVHLFVEETRYAMTGERRTVFPDCGDLIEPLARSTGNRPRRSSW